MPKCDFDFTKHTNYSVHSTCDANVLDDSAYGNTRFVVSATAWRSHCDGGNCGLRRVDSVPSMIEQAMPGFPLD